MARIKSLKVLPPSNGESGPGLCAVEGCGGRAVLRVTGARTGLRRDSCGDRRHTKAIERSFNEGLYVTPLTHHAAPEGVLPEVDKRELPVEDASGVVVQSDPVGIGGSEVASDTSTTEGPPKGTEDVVADGPVNESSPEPKAPGDLPEMEPREPDLLDELSANEALVRLRVGLIVEYVQPVSDRATGEFLRHPAMVTKILSTGGIVNLCVFNSSPSDAFDCVRAVVRSELDPQNKPGSWHFMES